MNGTHREIFDKNNNILRPKKVKVDQKEKEDPFKKYHGLRSVMSRQAYNIRNNIVHVHDPGVERIDKVAPKKSTIKKRNSQANLPMYRDTAPTKSVRSSFLLQIEIQKS